MSEPARYLVFDVESIGLHGEAFAVGWVVIDGEGNELDYGFGSCPPENARGSDEDRAWVQQNCPPLPWDCSTPAEVRSVFWRAWKREKANGAVLVADCAWPVEARFLAACIDVDVAERKWLGPYPLHDVATARLAAGLDPLATVERRPNEEPKHHPTCDARQSARIFIEALQACRPPACDHGVTFDGITAAEGLSSDEVRRRWPRLMGPCPKGCGFSGIAYASTAHFYAGDW